MSIPKLKATLLYFCHNTDPRFLGKVKLMKLFYFLDFNHLKKYGLPVTYDTYYKLEHGPIPSVIKNIIDEASENIEGSELSDTIYFKTPNGTIMRQCRPVRNFTKKDKSFFTKSEQEVLKAVCIKYNKYSTRKIEKSSHSESAWKNSEYAQKIQYSLAADDSDCGFSKQEIDLIIESFA